MNSIGHNSSCNVCQLHPFCKEDEKCAQAEKCLPQLAERCIKLKRGASLSWPSDKFESLYSVQHGALKTFETDSDGNESIRGFYFVGEVLGYEAIFTQTYPFTTVALCDSEVCEIPYAAILELLRTRPELQKHLLNLLSRQITYGQYPQVNAEQRVAAFLVDLSVRLHAEKNNPEFILPMSREDIGNYLRLTAETVSRIFSRLAANQLLEAKHKKLRLLDMEKLHTMAARFIPIQGSHNHGKNRSSDSCQMDNHLRRKQPRS